MATFASLTTRVQQQLMDSGNVVWDAAAVTEAIRSAVGEYGLAGESAVTLSGLDGAEVITLPEVHETLITVGAAGYAATARALNRAESFTLGSEAEALKAWGEARLKEFRAMLGFAFPAYLAVLAGEAGVQDPNQTAAETALLAAQAAAVTGKEARAQAAAEERSASKTAEAARKQALRASQNAPWGQWEDPEP